VPNYLVILKGKDGEYRGWRETRLPAGIAVRALFEPLPGSTSASDFVKGISYKWTDKFPPIIFDTVHMGYQGAISTISSGLASKGIGAVPTFRTDDNQSILEEVAVAAAMHRRGACLRLGSIHEYPDLAADAKLLPEALAVLGLTLTSIDLLIDFGDVSNSQEVAAKVQPALDALEWAHRCGPWRSVTLASGAFPKSISRFPYGSAQATHRHDAEFYGMVVARAPALLPDYGDYGIQNPEIPSSKGDLVRISSTQPTWIGRSGESKRGR
jgi:hypothetical protein